MLFCIANATLFAVCADVFIGDDFGGVQLLKVKSWVGGDIWRRLARPGAQDVKALLEQNLILSLVFVRFVAELRQFCRVPLDIFLQRTFHTYVLRGLSRRSVDLARMRPRVVPATARSRAVLSRLLHLALEDYSGRKENNVIIHTRT